MSEQVLLLFVKYPEVGRVKTRLARDVGDVEACRIYHQLVSICFTHGLSVPETDLIICGSGGSMSDFKLWLPGAADYWEQPSGELGERLSALFLRAFADGATRVAAIGADAPLLGDTNIEEALFNLRRQDICILPAMDGGYVLIGMGAYRQQLFHGMPWSTDRLLEKSLAVCDRDDLSVYLGKTFRDVDTAEDWNQIRPLLCQSDAREKISGDLR